MRGLLVCSAWYRRCGNDPGPVPISYVWIIHFTFFCFLDYSMACNSTVLTLMTIYAPRTCGTNLCNRTVLRDFIIYVSSWSSPRNRRSRHSVSGMALVAMPRRVASHQTSTLHGQRGHVLRGAWNTGWYSKTKVRQVGVARTVHFLKRSTCHHRGDTNFPGLLKKSANINIDCSQKKTRHVCSPAYQGFPVYIAGDPGEQRATSTD